jgi:pilus assembly protein Flp/PilA
VFSQSLNWLKSFGKKDGGATAIEYGLIAGLVAVATIGSIVTNGDYLSDTFTSVQTALDTGGGDGTGGAAGTGGGDTVAENGTAGDSPDSSAGTSSSGGIGNGPLDGQDESTSTGFGEDPPH